MRQALSRMQAAQAEWEAAALELAEAMEKATAALSPKPEIDYDAVAKLEMFKLYSTSSEGGSK